MNASVPIYLDNNATTPMSAEVADAMHRCERDCWGNPSSAHSLGMRAKERLGQARREVADLIGATPAELVFTSGATEANHMAIRGALAAMAPRRRVVASAVEHPSNLALLRDLEAHGARVTLVGVDREGRIDLDHLAAAVDDDTALVSVMWANNETGVLFPIDRIAAIGRRAGALVHTDAVQAAGRVPLDVRSVPVDLLSLSAHKLHGPKGIGALYVRKGCRIGVDTFGHQERGRRGGTENVPAIVAFGVAARLASMLAESVVPVVASLRDQLERGLAMRLPGSVIHGAMTSRLCNTASIRFDGIEAEPLLERLDRAGICASRGAACTSGGQEPSHVLLAMGLTREQAMATVRFSLSRFNNGMEIARTIEAVEGIVRAMAQPSLEALR